MQRLHTLTKWSIGTVAYQGAQGSHAVAQWLLDNPNQTWNNGYLIHLEAEDLDFWKFKLDSLEIPYSEFIEPDRGNITTSIAVLGHDRLFKKLKLIGWRDAKQTPAEIAA